MHSRKNFIIILSLLLIFIIQPIVKGEEQIKKAETQTFQKISSIMDLSSDNLDYFPESQQFIATGSAEVFLVAQNSRLKADKIIFNQDEQTILAIGNVKIIKNNLVVNGDYAKIELTKESALVSNPLTTVDVINIKSESANIYSDKIEALKGTASINQHFDMVFSSNSVGGFDTGRMFKKARAVDKSKKSNYRISSKEMTLIGGDERNIIKLKNASVYAGKYKVAYIPNLEISTDKDLTQIETLLPELGSKSTLGTYIGPGFVSYLPNGATLKTSPLLAWNPGVGVGGLARLTTKKSKTEFAYTTVKKKTVILGEYNFNKNWKLNYASNEYMDDGIMGRRMPRLGIDLVYEKPSDIKDLGLLYRNRLSAGFAQDYDSSWSTGRCKWQGDIMNKDALWNYKNYAQLRVQSQYDVTLYGNGVTTAVGRIGPRFDSEIGPFSFYTTYFMGGVHGKSPMLFDRYAYGKSNLIFRGEYYINRYASLSYLTYLNMSKDNNDGKMLAENQITASFGPDDVKLRLGFDTIRKRSMFGLDMLIGTDRTAFEFNKMNIINPGKFKKTQNQTQTETDSTKQL
jgi:hypothetical protein